MGATKTVWQLDANGYYLWPTVADESQREPGVFHIPAGCVDVELPEIPQGKRARFVDVAFVLEDLPTPPPPAPPPPPPPQSVEQKVSVLLAGVGCCNKKHLEKDINLAEGLGLKEGFDPQALYLANPTYRDLINARDAIAALGNQP